MKLLLFCLLLLYPLPSLAQTPEKFSNYIAIQTTDSAAVAYRNMAGILQDMGYTISKSDKDLLTISTDLVGNGLPNAGKMMLSVYVRGQANAQIHLSGQFTAPGISTEPDRIVYRGMKGSPFMASWANMQKVAQAYPGGTLSFGKK